MFNLLQKKSNITETTFINTSIYKNTNINTTIIKYSILVINDSLQKNQFNILNNEYLSIKDIFLLDKRNNSFINPNKMMISNFIYSIDAKREIDNDIISNNWKSFINYHLSEDFNNQLFDTFNTYNKLKINNKIIKYDKINSSSVNVSRNTPLNNFMFLKCISPINYFNKNLNIKEIDNNKLFIGWFFLKKDNDFSIGGSLTIFKKYIQYTKCIKKTTFIDQETNQEKDTEIEEIKEEEIKDCIISIPYQQNTLIILSIEEINQNNKNEPYTEKDNISEVKLYYEFEPRNITFQSQRYIEFGLEKI